MSPIASKVLLTARLMQRSSCHSSAKTICSFDFRACLKRELRELPGRMSAGYLLHFGDQIAGSRDDPDSADQISDLLVTSLERVGVDGDHRLDFVARYLGEVRVVDPSCAEVGDVGVA
jgi:hypothetical protein